MYKTMKTVINIQCVSGKILIQEELRKQLRSLTDFLSGNLGVVFQNYTDF